MAMIRAFVAVQLPAEVRLELGRVTGVLAGQTPERSVRWVRPELVHLTLRFLGDTAVAQLPAIAAALDDVGRRVSPLTLRLGRLGCFPNPQRPRVVWVGLDGDEASLLALKQMVDAALAPLGWAVEARPFQAHLTLGRVNDGRQVAGLPWRTEVRPLVVPVTAIHLIESQLQRGGPVYTVRHSSQLPGDFISGLTRHHE